MAGHRATSVHPAGSLAPVDGLDRLSIGRLAAVLGMSKSGLYAHFGSATELQLATVAEAARVFDTEVVQPALAAPAGLRQLTAGCEAFFEHLERHTFPGGRFMCAPAPGLGPRPGPVRATVPGFHARLGDLIPGLAALPLAPNEPPA